MDSLDAPMTSVYFYTPSQIKEIDDTDQSAKILTF